MTSKHLVDGLVKVTIVPTEELASLRAECQVANKQRDQAQRWYKEKCAEVEQLKGTVSFMEKSYLEEHGHWGNCQWKIRYEQRDAEITRLRAEVEKLKREVGEAWLTGWQEALGLVKCPECGGSGSIYEEDQRDEPIVTLRYDCPRCHGHRWIRSAERPSRAGE
jgi:DNA-directed RNA polymerase subunit M/transcription elongation factor TFIIS